MTQHKQDIEPIKASTLSTFEWNPVDAFIEHLKEIGDPRVESTAKDSEALRKGEEAHRKVVRPVGLGEERGHWRRNP